MIAESASVGAVGFWGCPEASFRVSAVIQASGFWMGGTALMLRRTMSLCRVHAWNSRKV
jgi:hypothetical protein